ncbi:MAG: alcohol dehydrogenase catalytic domain-containing protein [Chloroflexi bacterium]|nr:alcohol dehydrogenase catalytic domain-containing protein [Chloroflexota bacterium]
MKVLKYIEPRRVEIRELERPSIQAGEVLVQLHACGVCATDVKTFMRGHPHIKPGTVLGHEMTGIIAESQAEGWQIGERVVVAPYVPCEDCRYCARGQFTLCEKLFEAYAEPGGFSEFLRVPQRIVQKGLFRLPAEIDFALGSLVEPIACSYHGLEALRLGRNDSFLIIGDGPMGLIQAILAREFGASPVVLAGLTPSRLELAAQFADRVIDVSKQNLRDEIKTLTNDAGIDKVMVSVGQAQVAEDALALVRRGGVVNLFAGLPSSSRISVDPGRIHYDQVTLIGTFGFAHTHFALALRALMHNPSDFAQLITATVRLDGLEKAFIDSAQYAGIKTVAILA